jgi:hypothetical protein
MKKRTLITILTWNRLDKTRQTIKSLYKHNTDDFDLLFIDNGSTDGTVEYLERRYEVIKNKTNEGIFNASSKVWEEGVERGYDFILNLQNDFPCTRKIPFKELEAYMDKNEDVCYIRLNKKKDKKFNLVTTKPIRYGDPVSVGDYSIKKCNYHAGFNPALIRSSIIKDFSDYDGDNPRERVLMNNFERIGKQCAKLFPDVFDTLKQGSHKGEWKH